MGQGRRLRDAFARATPPMERADRARNYHLAVDGGNDYGLLVSDFRVSTVADTRYRSLASRNVVGRMRLGEISVTIAFQHGLTALNGGRLVDRLTL